MAVTSQNGKTGIVVADTTDMQLKCTISVLLLVALGACGPSIVETEEWSILAPTTLECPYCPEESDLVDVLVAERETQKSAARFSPTPESDFEDDLKQCYQVGKMPWEDEDAPGSGDDIAFNCRDFTRWFIECMNRLGHSNVEGLSVWCKNCDSGSGHGHRIAIYEKPDGTWCPGEPQRESGGENEDCCKKSKKEASQCALNDHCDISYDACCEPEEFFNRSADYCKGEKCRYEIDIDGKPYLNCDLPVIGSGSGAIPEPPTSPPFWTECRKAIHKCLKENPTSCGDCKRSELDACKPDVDCGDETSNSKCTQCCIDSTSNHDDKMACLKDSGCASKGW